MLAKPVVEIAPRTWLISEYKLVNMYSVSYTHLDVYKRQAQGQKRRCFRPWAGRERPGRTTNRRMHDMKVRIGIDVGGTFTCLLYTSGKRSRHCPAEKASV